MPGTILVPRTRPDGLIALVLAAVTGHHDYRIWTWRARRLLFFTIW